MFRNQEKRLFAATILVVLLAMAGPMLAAVPGLEMRHLGQLELADYRFSYVTAEDRPAGTILLFGGSAPTGSWSTVIREYTAATNSWQQLSVQLPYAYVSNERHGAARASNGRFYLGPGIGPGGWGQNDQIIEVDLDAGSVTERAPIVAPGANIWGIAVAPAPISLGGVYLFGGWNGGGINSIRHYDPVTDQVRLLTAELSVARTVGARVNHPDGRIYLFGGNTSSPATFRAVEIFDPATETLTAVPNPGLYGFNHGTQAWVGPDGGIYLWNPDAPYLGDASRKLIHFDPSSADFTDLGAQPLDGYNVIGSAQLSQSGAYFFGIAYPGSVWGVSADTSGEVWKLSHRSPADPDVHRVVFTRGNTPNRRPWIANLDGSGATELGAIDVVGHAKIAAGRVVFMADDYQSQGPGIYRMDAYSGAEITKILNTENIGGHSTGDALDISPDGTRVVWAGPEPGDSYVNHNLYVIGIDGSGKTRIRRNTSQHHFMITWGEPERIALMVSAVGNAFSQRPHTIRPDGSELTQVVGDFSQSPHTGGVEGRMALTWEQPEPYLVTLNNAFDDFREVPGRPTGYRHTSWHPNELAVFGCSEGDLYRVDVQNGDETLLVSGGSLPCLGGDVGRGGEACQVEAFPGEAHCSAVPEGGVACDLEDWSLAGVGNANQLALDVIPNGAGDFELALTADGATAYLGADNAGFFYRALSGDFRVETTVDSTPMTTGKEWRKAGLMARASLDSWDVRLLTTLAPVQQRLQFVARQVYGGPGNVKLGFEVEGAPAVVRLAIERQGQTLSVQYSLDDGVTWMTPDTGLGGSIEISNLPETLLVGPVMVSNNISVTSTAHFDDLSICPGPS